MTKLNENKPYYKQIGKVPKEWTLRKFGDVFEFLNTSSITREYLTNQKLQNAICCIHYGDIHAKFTKEILDLDEENEVSFIKDGVDLPENISFLKDGDLVIADASEDYTGVGECVELINIKKKKIIGGLHTIVARDKNNYTCNGYRCYIFRHPGISKYLKVIATGISVYGIAESNLTNIEIPLPSLTEQKTIAVILSTWDKAIETTQQLIVQKELRKKILMQRLLTGKKRLAGFTERWKTKSLGEILIPMSRAVEKPTKSFLALGIRSHGKGTFLKEEFDPKTIEMETLYTVKENDLIVNITFAWEGAIAIAGHQDEGALVSHRFPMFTFNRSEGIVDYFRYVIIQPRFKYMLGLISPGGAGRNRVLSKGDFLKLELKLPDTKEQSAIAKVLRTADKELELLRQKLDALKLQKKGLMQKLLTGQIRVNKTGR
jgi:type I restriction enzyme S subunit